MPEYGRWNTGCANEQREDFAVSWIEQVFGLGGRDGNRLRLRPGALLPALPEVDDDDGPSSCERFPHVDSIDDLAVRETRQRNGCLGCGYILLQLVEESLPGG